MVPQKVCQHSDAWNLYEYKLIWHIGLFNGNKISKLKIKLSFVIKMEPKLIMCPYRIDKERRHQAKKVNIIWNQRQASDSVTNQGIPGVSFSLCFCFCFGPDTTMIRSYYWLCVQKICVQKITVPWEPYGMLCIKVVSVKFNISVLFL